MNSDTKNYIPHLSARSIPHKGLEVLQKLRISNNIIHHKTRQNAVG